MRTQGIRGHTGVNLLLGVVASAVLAAGSSRSGLPDEAPRLEPAPEEPQGKLRRTGPPHDEYAQPPEPERYDRRWGTIDFAE